ncbi:TonB-dependent receptor plug domain-containing protein [Sphingomonas sp.]|uniref:TonB-dependent receptor plug domain-containing protein n=1 Tax=Sphingomonas sp. TaxID=28214 RepID=UPI0035BC7B66
MRTTLLLSTAVVALISAFAGAQVQETVDPTPSESVSAAAAPDRNGLGDIIVTAQRQSENSQRAAVPLSVIEGGALLASGITQVDRLNSLAPALSIVPTNTGNAAFIRGVGNFTLAPNSDPAIAFNYDGVYVGRPTSTTGVFYDLERVEILKGPQGILYGRNATGGAINVLPAQPRIGEFSGNGSLTYGNYDTLNAEGAINLPVGDRGAIRLSASRASHDGYLSDGTSDEKTWAARAQMEAELTPDLSVRVAGDYAHNGGFGAGIDYVGSFAGTTLTPSNIPIGTGINAPASQAFRTARVFAPIGNRLTALGRPFQDNTFLASMPKSIGTPAPVP